MHETLDQYSMMFIYILQGMDHVLYGSCGLFTRAARQLRVIKGGVFFLPSTANFSLVFLNVSHALFNGGFDCRPSLFSIE